jgi:hypothetical protein
MPELEKKIQYLSDMDEINKLQGKYQYLLYKQEWKTVADECFVRHTPGAMMEASDSGVFLGIEGIDRFFNEHMAMVGKKTGFFTLHTAVTPAVEIAEDGQSAKGVWFSLGCFGCKGVEDAWAWGTYIISYVKEDGVWKLWRVNFTPHFRAPYSQGWGKVPVSASVRDGLEDGPPTAWNPYNPDTTAPEMFAHLPDVPRPYKTMKMDE